MTLKVWGVHPGDKLNTEFFTFPGGEEGVKILSLPTYRMSVAHIEARLRSSSDVIRLMMLTDALRRLPHAPLKMVLYMNYVPYARQDRVCNPGESHSARVFCDLINGLGYDEVVIVDPHSDVIGALLNNVTIHKQASIVGTFPGLNEDLRNGRYTLVSPDAGSQKKIFELSVMYGLDVIRADKVRETSTGRIVRTEVYCDDLKGRPVLIVDDICDGGRTFIELAKVLKVKGAGEVSLYVTHGIFSKGIGELAECIDTIYTTDSFCTLNAGTYVGNRRDLKLNVKEL